MTVSGQKACPTKDSGRQQLQLAWANIRGERGRERELGGATLGNYPQQTGGRGERVVKKMFCFPAEVSNIE